MSARGGGVICGNAGTSSQPGEPRPHHLPPPAPPPRRAFTAAQLVLQCALGWRCAGDLPLCLLLQTLVLVAFNKVCTAQYFVWYITFLPLVLPQLAVAPNRVSLHARCARGGQGSVRGGGRRGPCSMLAAHALLPSANGQGRLVAAALGWAGAMAHWLAWAYLLEFEGHPMHLAVWAASLAFFAAHVWLVCEVLTAWRHVVQRPPALQQRVVNTWQ